METLPNEAALFPIPEIKRVRFFIGYRLPLVNWRVRREVSMEKWCASVAPFLSAKTSMLDIVAGCALGGMVLSHGRREFFVKRY